MSHSQLFNLLHLAQLIIFVPLNYLLNLQLQVRVRQMDLWKLFELLSLQLSRRDAEIAGDIRCTRYECFIDIDEEAVS